MRRPEDELALIREQGLYRQDRLVRPTNPVEIQVEGQSFVQFAANDYLGLAHSPELTEAYREAAAHLPAGSGASRLITGTHPIHRELEEELAVFKQTERALAFSSGYAVASGCLPALVRKGDFILLDKLCHACLIDGARLSGATLRVFPHNDLDKLARLLDSTRDQVSPEGRILVVTESVFSMDGDLASLPEIVELKDRAGALLWLDEAHAVGVVGPQGRGLAEEMGLTSRIDFQMGTLSKAAAVSGGYLAAAGPWIDLLVNSARSFIFSTAPPPPVAAAALASIRLIQGPAGDARRSALWRNLRQFEAALPTSRPLTSAICPVIVGESEEALQRSAALRERGYWVPAIRFPTVPRGSARLRVSFSAAHQPAQIEGLARSLRDLLSPDGDRQEPSI